MILPALMGQAVSLETVKDGNSIARMESGEKPVSLRGNSVSPNRLIYRSSKLATIKKLFKNLNDRLSCNNFGLGGLAVVFDEFNRRAMAVIMSST